MNERSRSTRLQVFLGANFKGNPCHSWLAIVAELTIYLYIYLIIDKLAKYYYIVYYNSDVFESGHRGSTYLRFLFMRFVVQIRIFASRSMSNLQSVKYFKQIISIMHVNVISIMYITQYIIFS